MPRRISPIIERNRANVYADAVSYAAIPVNSAGCSVNTKLLWRFNWPPYFVTVMFANNLAFGLKIRVNRQKLHQVILRGASINAFLKKVIFQDRIFSLGLLRLWHQI